jgi:lysophospholipase L1-like esterase
MTQAILLWAALVSGAAPPRGEADFALRDGDTVVFLGDSITAARTYGKFIENYTLLRFPDRRVRFVNAGRGGDTAAGGLARLERDVFAHKATVLTVAYGVNDIGWGLRADDKHRRQYLDAIAGIVEACRKRGVRVYICSAAVTAADPFKSEESFLQKMCDEGMKLATVKGGQAIDVQRGMREVQKRIGAYNEKFVKDAAKKESLHVADGVHLNELGQLAMAYAILKGLGAPADVSSLEIDAAGCKVVTARGCTAGKVEKTGDQLRFVRHDRGLPFNGGTFFALHYRFVPIPEGLNRYLLAVRNLAEGRYEVRADGRLVGTFTAAQLEKGVNISSATGDAWQPGGPWMAQADVLRSLTEARHQLATAGLLARAWLPGGEVTKEVEAASPRTNAEIEELQRKVARPRPYRFAVRPAPAKKGK